jgi:phosphoribosylamine--glycine ligase
MEWRKNPCMSIVICSKGYQNKQIENKRIDLKNIKLKEKSFIFHAGTKIKDGLLFSNGGRVLNIVVLGNSFLKIRNQIFKKELPSTTILRTRPPFENNKPSFILVPA